MIWLKFNDPILYYKLIELAENYNFRQGHWLQVRPFLLFCTELSNE